MYGLLVRIIVLAALAELGISLVTTQNCHSRHCVVESETYSRKILRIHWKPISVFPEEGSRFR